MELNTTDNGDVFVPVPVRQEECRMHEGYKRSLD